MTGITVIDFGGRVPAEPASLAVARSRTCLRTLRHARVERPRVGRVQYDSGDSRPHVMHGFRTTPR